MKTTSDIISSYPSDTSSGVTSADRPGVYIQTFGCAMNEYDTEKMLLLLGKTHQRVSSPEEAQVVIVNTCSVREKGEQKLFSLLGRMRELKATRPELIIGVSGCVAQQEGQGIIQREKAVDFVVGTHNLSLVPSLVAQAKGGVREQVAIDYREEWEELPEEFDILPERSNEALPKGYHSQVRALVSIQRGCNKRCSYCVVPTTRGVEVSRSPEEILREIRLKVRLGAREVLLLGQTVNSYGKDLTPRLRFEELVRRIAEIPELRRIRFISPHPQDVRPEFIELYGSIPQLVPHIHLPLQSGSDPVLKTMNRNYRMSRFLDIVGELRARLPEIAISTDIIVGFPTESDADFDQTMNVLESIRFDFAYYYKYSARPNTTALIDYPTLLPDEVVSERFQRLDRLQGLITAEKNQARVGTITQVLFEGRGSIPGMLRGRIPENTSIDVTAPPEYYGQELPVRVTQASRHGLRGEPA